MVGISNKFLIESYLNRIPNDSKHGTCKIPDCGKPVGWQRREVQAHKRASCHINQREREKWSKIVKEVVTTVPTSLNYTDNNSSSFGVCSSVTSVSSISASNNFSPS